MATCGCFIFQSSEGFICLETGATVTAFTTDGPLCTCIAIITVPALPPVFVVMIAGLVALAAIVMIRRRSRVA